MSSTDPGAARPGAPTDDVMVDVETVETVEVAEPPIVLDAPVDQGLAARAGAEALGAFGLVLVVLGAAVYLPISGAGTLGVALGGGLVLAALVAALGHVSGGHFNPAVSLAAALGGRITWLDAAVYWVAQLVGAVVAAAVVYVTVPTGLPGLIGADGARGLMTTAANGWGDQSELARLTQGQATFDLRAALILEIVAAAAFVAVYLGVAARRASRAVAPIAVGFAYAALLLVTGPVTRGGLNPARSTAAALFSEGEALGQLWLFWLAPVIAAVIVGLFALAFAPVTEPFATGDLEDDDLVPDDEALPEGEEQPGERL